MMKQLKMILFSMFFICFIIQNNLQAYYYCNSCGIKNNLNNNNCKRYSLMSERIENYFLGTLLAAVIIIAIFSKESKVIKDFKLKVSDFMISEGLSEVDAMYKAIKYIVDSEHYTLSEKDEIKKYFRTSLDDYNKKLRTMDHNITSTNFNF